MSADQLDLSKLRIRREEQQSEAVQTRPRSQLFLYVGGALAIILVIALFLLTSFRSEELVEVTTVEMISPSQANALLTASGYVVAQRKAAVASKATGRIVYLGFQEGDRVQKGDIIARIESADVEASLAQARADLNVAKADNDDALRTFERAKTLVDRQLISQAEYDGAKSRYERVLASIASKKAAVQAADVQLENTRIRAPFNGTILTKNADIGEVVAPFAAGASSRVAVVTIADMNSLQVEADVSESNIERITIEQPCEVTLDAYPDKRYRGIVDKIVPTADRAKATVLTKVRFLEKDNRVLPEMSAKVQFLSGQVAQNTDTSPKLAVNPAAVVSKDGKKVSFVVRDNTVTETAIITGGVIGPMVEVTGGLFRGDRVVVRPSEHLQSGAKVKVKQ